eukprot:1662953-Prymnesium_polylepis.1
MVGGLGQRFGPRGDALSLSQDDPSERILHACRGHPLLVSFDTRLQAINTPNTVESALSIYLPRVLSRNGIVVVVQSSLRT